MKNNPLARLDVFATLARDESSPPTDVADRVLATLNARQPIPPAHAPEYFMVGIGSLIAACAASLLFWVSLSDDSLFALAQPFITVMQ